MTRLGIEPRSPGITIHKGYFPEFHSPNLGVRVIHEYVLYKNDYVYFGYLSVKEARHFVWFNG